MSTNAYIALPAKQRCTFFRLIASNIDFERSLNLRGNKNVKDRRNSRAVSGLRGLQRPPGSMKRDIPKSKTISLQDRRANGKTRLPD